MRLRQRPSIAFWLIFLVFIVLPVTGCGSPAEPSAAPINFITPSAVSSVDLAKMLSAVKTATAEPDPDGVELLRVGLAPELSQIVVTFTSPPEVVDNWWQGSVYVVDEARNMIYKDIPVAPLLGPLLGKPKEPGQVGYAMLINFDQGVKPGSVVTVVMGKYKREHIKVE